MSLLFLAIALSMDVFAVALCRGMTAPPQHVLRTALPAGLVLGAAHGLMPLLGWGLTAAMAGLVRDLDHWVSFALLVLIGGHMLQEARRPEGEAAPVANGGSSLVAVALATSIDAAVAGGTFAGLGQSVAVGCAALAFAAFGFAVAGVYLGRVAGAAAGPRAQVLGGLVLIALAIKIVVDHEVFGA